MKLLKVLFSLVLIGGVCYLACIIVLIAITLSDMELVVIENKTVLQEVREVKCGRTVDFRVIDFSGVVYSKEIYLPEKMEIVVF